MKRLIDEIVILAVFLGLLSMVVGCKTQVKGGSTLDDDKSLSVRGGESRTDTGLATIRLDADGSVTIDYQRDRSAATQPSSESSSSYASTTQPSVTTQGSATPRIKSEEGEWSLSFDRVKLPPKSQWPLFFLFGVAGFIAFRYGGSIPVGLLCGGLALLSVIWPGVLGWLALAAVALAAWSARKTIIQLIQGNQEAVKGKAEQAQEALIAAWRGAQDETTQRVVKSLRR